MNLHARKDGLHEAGGLLYFFPAHRIYAPGTGAFRAQQVAGRHLRRGLMGLPSTLVVARRLRELPSFGLGLDYSSAAVVLRNGALLERRREARLALEAYQPLGADQPLRLVHEVGRALVPVAVVRDREAAGELHCFGLRARQWLGLSG